MSSPISTASSSSSSRRKSWVMYQAQLMAATLFAGLQTLPIGAALAAGPAPGTVIQNQATGSFVDVKDGSLENIESNIVQVTVTEVAGVTVTPAGLFEAPTGVSGAGSAQGNGSFDSEDIVYFVYEITNVGNDPTQFFIPGTVSSVTNGAQFGQIEIIEIDSDGPGPTPPTDLQGSPVPIQNSGNNTGDTISSGQPLVLGLPQGSLPPDGTLKVRVPVKFNAGLNPGDPVTAVLGDTNGNDNSANTQNQVYSANGSNGDLYTQDNQDGDGIANETPGDPANGDSTNHRQEASAKLNATVGDSDSSTHLVSGVLFVDSNGDDALSTEPRLTNVTVHLYKDLNNDGVLDLNDDQNGDGVLDANDSIASDVTDSSGAYSFQALDGNYLIQPDTNDPDLLGYTYGGVTGTANDPLNNPRNVDVNGADVIAGLDFPYDLSPVDNSCSAAEIINSDFEDPDIASTLGFMFSFGDSGGIPLARIYDEAIIPGWLFDGPNNDIEIWQAGHIGGDPAPTQSYSGVQHAEINATTLGAIYQDVATTPGITMGWEFAHRGRRGPDTMELFIGPPGATVSQGTFTTSNDAWKHYTGTYSVPAGQTMTRFEFRAVSTASGNNAAGNHIDAVKFALPSCLVGPQATQDFGDAPSSYDDIAGSNTPANHSFSPNLYLGDLLGDRELAPTSSTDADGDDSLAAPSLDDEDGITTFPGLNDTSTTYSLDLTVNNNPTGISSIGSAVNVYAWIDFDGDGEFDEDERATVTNGTIALGGSGQVPDNSSGTVTLNWNNIGTSGPDIVSGDSYVRIRVTRANLDQITGEANNRDDASLGVAIDGEVEDYPLTITSPSTNNPNVLLVKRITAVNGNTVNGGINLATYDPDPAFFYDDNIIDPSATPADTDKWPVTSGETSSNFLLGARYAGITKPDDEVEYTIYFLSTGEKDAHNVQFCDRVPDFQTFVPDAFNLETPAPNGGTGANRGVVVDFNGNRVSHTNDADGDSAQYYPPGSTLPAACNGIPAQTEDNGAVVVNLGTLPKATSAGNPLNSFGFFRFRAKVK